MTVFRQVRIQAVPDFGSFSWPLRQQSELVRRWCILPWCLHRLATGHVSQLCDLLLQLNSHMPMLSSCSLLSSSCSFFNFSRVPLKGAPTLELLDQCQTKLPPRRKHAATQSCCSICVKQILWLCASGTQNRISGPDAGL